jgi:hypothetical protein
MMDRDGIELFFQVLGGSMLVLFLIGLCFGAVMVVPATLVLISAGIDAAFDFVWCTQDWLEKRRKKAATSSLISH